MKHHIKFVMLLLFLSSVSAWAETRLETLGWLDNEVTADTNSANGNIDKGGAFYIGRLYLTLTGEGKDWFGNTIRGCFTADFSKPATPLKFAYFDWVLLNEAVLSGGLLKSYFGYLSEWNYPIPVKSAEETYSNISPTKSADFGLALSGKLFSSGDNKQGFINYYIQVLNGEGSENIFSGTNTKADNYAEQVSLYILLFKGLSIGGTFRYQDYNSSTLKREVSWAVGIKASDPAFDALVIPVDFLLQYIGLVSTLDNAAVSGYVASFTLGYKLFDGAFTPYIRYDYASPDSVSNVRGEYVGANIKPGKDLAIKPLFGYSRPSGEINIKLELEYKFETVWQ